jgi:uncharacterized protein YbjQ (UPF0145 family)
MIELGITLALVAIGFFFGSHIEKKHYLDLQQREHFLLARVPVRTDPGPKLTQGETFLVTSSVVVAADYFKTFVGNIKSIFGGNLHSLESLLDRARREAVCRLREKALKSGASQIVDLHIETSFIDQMGAEVSVSGTAIRNS